VPSLKIFIAALFFGGLYLPLCRAQQTSANFFSGKESTVLRFEAVGIADTGRSVLKVLIREIDTPETVLGATVLLRRENDKMYGRVTQADGRCHFKVGGGDYTVRVQMTGLASFEQPGFLLEKGKSYTLEIGMAKL